ncbi:nicotinate-nucleotide adenylyltransferase [Acetobacter vaccinii]|uniref:nicotinate-nucleotide adenylyltransferase n=1 Tax=Acetobacter vaccinii TaxID=2592655 RepID=UPI001FF01DE3|nr:nicotinate-nucleotide adenylyltransferase [Acetobacter vaccinii]
MPQPRAEYDGVPTWGDARRCRIGLLGGSFNPAHAGHLAIARRALVQLRLDQVWLMVSPGNPLKPRRGMAPLAQRLQTARQLVDGRRVIATDIEARIGTRYTVDTLRCLKARFKNAHFVWLTGADGLVTLPRWKGWRGLVHTVAMAVFPRPGQNFAALNGAAGHYMARWRLPACQAGCLAMRRPPVWAFLPGAQNSISATAIRRQGGFSVSVDHAPPTASRNSGESS